MQKLYDDIAPYTHNLGLLISKTNINAKLNDQQKIFINEIEPLNVEARYPKYKEQIRAFLSEEKCSEIIHNTIELHKCIKKML